MEFLDLREVRCPLALLLFKQKLMLLGNNTEIKVLFSNQEALQDICLYLDKKNYCYSCECSTLLVQFSD